MTLTSPSLADVALLVDAPYSPSSTAIRINSLWFASLVFSLATASFGMLVKQWLREYLACEYTSPQARLRIRQRRNPGLHIWKVFQIAAMLPLLLQLSLALFFVGLCVFTWSINQQVARPTIVFVCAWAFFLIASIILPVFYPTCPYQTTAFLRVTKFLRLRLVALRRRASRASLAVATSRSIASYTKWMHVILSSVGRLVKPRDYEEEEIVAQDQNKDAEVLISVDAALTDDTILETTIWEALQQLRLPPHDNLVFLFEIIKHRSPLPSLQPVVPHLVQLLDLRSLGLQAWQAITDIAASVFSLGVESSATTLWSGETTDAFLVLLSYSSYALPARHIPLLQQCFKKQHWPACLVVLTRQVAAAGSQAQEQILRCFREPLAECPIELAMAHLGLLVEAVTSGHGTPSPLWTLFVDQWRANSQFDGVLQMILDILADCVTKVTRDRDAPLTVPEREALYTVILSLLSVPISASLSRNLCAIFRQLCGHPDGMRGLLEAITGSAFSIAYWDVDRITAHMRHVYTSVMDDESESFRSDIDPSLTIRTFHSAADSSRQHFLGCSRVHRASQRGSRCTTAELCPLLSGVPRVTALAVRNRSSRTNPSVQERHRPSEPARALGCRGARAGSVCSRPERHHQYTRV